LFFSVSPGVNAWAKGKGVTVTNCYGHRPAAIHASAWVVEY